MQERREREPATLLAESLLYTCHDHLSSLGVELTHLVPSMVVLRMAQVRFAPFCLAPRRLLAQPVQKPASSAPLAEPTHHARLLRREVGPVTEIQVQAHPPVVILARYPETGEAIVTNAGLRLDEVAEFAGKLGFVLPEGGAVRGEVEGRWQLVEEGGGGGRGGMAGRPGV